MTKTDTSTAPDPGTPDEPKTDTRMTPDDFAGLRAQATTIGLQDRQLGAMLHSLILHLGHLHGFDPVQEDARVAEQTRKDRQAEEDSAAKGVDHAI